ncbi:hypothetical protein LC087_02515 [Bacillus carboniphilus]|uniref:Uncharacterized protein n=1 Tax=Bacillus carboniphilus TaxID=86663 RepID=A0ABY9JZS2_9BACI|nr:hypothetical protein [Bacillus carboniphilus]WLR43100.1 hypothetical protein LC087_02515 [Bacillus carboniphilus]
MGKKLIFKKCNDITVDDSQKIKQVGVDKNGNIFILYELDHFIYKITHYVNNDTNTYLFKINKKIDFIGFLKEEVLFVKSVTSEDEDNAFLYNLDGLYVKSFFVGTGISVCQTDHKGEVWIGYNDEGIFEPNSLGENGIICLNEKGEIIIFEKIHKSMEQGLVPIIDECYAMSMFQKSIWMCYLGNFNTQLIRVENENNISVWNDLKIGTVDCFATNGKFVVLNENKGYFLLNLELQTMLDLIPCNENNKVIDPDRTFAFNNKVFIISGEAAYISEI